MVEYIKQGVLPMEEMEARKITLNRNNYDLVDDILFHVEPDKTLKIVPLLLSGKNFGMRFIVESLEDTYGMPKCIVNCHDIICGQA